MLTSRLLVCVVAALVAAPSIAAEPPALGEFIARGDAGLTPPPERAPEGAYAHIYQAPLFGALFSVSASESAVDESALRYYASLHNFVRANAEIKRLKALHPNWTPPTNIYSAAGAGADEQPFWDMLAADRMEELQAGLALKERSTPDWKPSRDLTAKIARKAAIKALVKASDDAKWTEALAIADADPSILHCAYMDANWRVADAFLALGLQSRAFEIYHAVIATCPDHDERLATVKKSVSRFSFEETRSLIAMGAKSADGATEFDGAKIDLTRARVAAANAGRTGAIEPEALADFFAEVSRSQAPGDLGLAGWFEYNRGRFEAAESWFALAKLEAPAAADAAAVNLVEGRALALFKLGRFEPALALAYDWRDRSANLRATYAGACASLLTRTPPPELAPARLADFAAFVEDARQPAGAAAIGWYRYNRAEWDEAALWFRSALDWRSVDPAAGPPVGGIDPDVASALEGYGRALAHAGRLDEATRIADRWRGAGPALEKIFVELMGAAVDAAPSAAALNPGELADYSEFAQRAKSAPAAAALGWLGYRSADYETAIGWFRKASGWTSGGRGDLSVSQGLALALKQTGRLAEAEELAWALRDSPDLRAIYLSAVIAELAADKPALPPARLARFVTIVNAERSAAGARALGWRRLNQGNCVYAAPWFRRAAAWSADSAEDASTARGLALSLKAVGAYNQAQDLAYAWRERDRDLRALHVDIGVEQLMSEAPAIAMGEARLARLSQAVLADRHARGAQALGWFRYRQAACGYGGQWMRLATDWTDEDKRDAKTDEGLGLTLRATGRLSEAASVAWRWRDAAPLMQKLYIDTMVETLSRDNPPEPVDEARLREFVGVIAPIHSALGAQALGWYRLERHEFDEAARWFRQALDWWPTQRRDMSQRLSAPVDDYQPILAKLALAHEDYRRTPRAYPNSSALIGKSRELYVNTEEGLAKTEEGYAQTLRALGRLDEAEAIASAWRTRWPSLGRLYLDIVADALNKDGPEIAPERLARYAAAIEEARSASAATAYGWRQLRAHAPEAAAKWFARALAWEIAEPPDAGLVEGYVEALQGQNKFDEADRLAARWRAASPRFEVVYLRSQLAALRASGRPEAAMQAQFAAIEAEVAKTRSADAALSLGWFAYETKDFARALNWFRKAADWGGDAKAREGVALALRALDRFAELAEFGAAERGASPAARDAYYGGMIAWLTADKPADPQARAGFEQAVAADRSAQGAEALGWAGARRADWAQARKWFENALAWSALDPLAPPQQPDAAQFKIAEGYARALRGGGELERAEDVAFAWSGAPALAELYVEIASQAVADDALSPQRLARFEAFAENGRSVDAAAALGWRAYRAHAPADAVRWFERALAGSATPAAKLAEGYALSLRAAGRLEDAESFSWRLAGQSEDLRAVYISTVAAELADDKATLPPARLDRFARTVEAAHASAGAQALGWRRLAEDNCVYAAPWFRKAAAWSVDGAADGAIARGLSLSLRKAGAFAQAEDVAYAWSARIPEMRALYLDIGAEALARETPVSDARLARFAEAALAARSAKAARALGWRRYADAGCGYGGQWLRLAGAWSDEPDAKTDEGYALSLRSVGGLAEAEALAQRVPDLRKLYIDVVAEELSRDNPPEPLDEARLKSFVDAIEPLRSSQGAQALGWYRLERGEYDEATRWFAQALAWWPARRHEGPHLLAAPAPDYVPVLARLALEAKDYRRTPRAYPNTSKRTDAADYATEEAFAKTQEGYAQALRALGRVEEAEAIAFAWRDRWPGLRTLFLEIAIAALDARDGPAPAPQRLQRFLDAIETERSTAGAAAMAWREYRLGGYDDAAQWFQKALAWTHGDTPPRGLVEGYVMALEGAKKFDAAAAAAAKWRNVSPDFNLVYLQSELQRLGAAGKAGLITREQYAEIEKTFAGAKSAAGALALAWIAYETHDYGHALVWFERAGQWDADLAGAKATEGKALSLRALERFEELAEFGAAHRHELAPVRDAYFAGMVQWLTSDKPLREVNPQARADFETAVAEERSAEGAQALAWGALMRGDWLIARKWFETGIDWSGFDALVPPAAPDAARAKLVEGYVQALRAGGEWERAEDVAYVWRDGGATLGGLYIEIFTQQLAAAGASPSAERIARFATVAQARRSPQAAGALGWQAYRERGYGEAISWFEKAASWSPGQVADAKVNEGLALSLRAAGRLVEAEDFAWEHRQQSRELKAAYVAAFSDQLLDPKLSATLPARRLDRFAELVAAEKLSGGAAALGWRRLQDGNCGYSLGWFRKAIAWAENGGDDKLHSGLAQGLRAVGMFNEAEDEAFAYAGRSAEARELYINIGVEELTRRWPRVPMSEPRIARFSAIAAADRSAKAAQAIAWRRYSEAGCGYGGRWFELAADWSGDRRGDARLNEGYALTLRAVGRLAKAEGVASPWIERAQPMKKLYIDVAVEELSRDNPPEPIPEARVAAFETAFTSVHSALGAQALGWYRFARREYEPAARWFALALDWWPPRRADADQKLSAPVDDYSAILAQLALRPEDYRRTPRAYPNSSLLIGHDTESYVDTQTGLAKTVEGYVRALAALSRFDEAEALGLKWLERWSPLRAVLIDIAAAELSAPGAERITAERQARFVKLIEEDRSAVGAEALGWRAYRAKDYSGAEHWLRAAIDWRPAEVKLGLDLARAYADTLRALKRYDEALSFVEATSARAPGLGGFAVDIGLDSLGALDPHSSAAQERLRGIAVDVSAAKSAGGALSLGWLAYNRKEFAGAQAWFRKAIEWAPAGADPDPKALEGYARSLQGEGRYADFMRFADGWSARQPALKPLFLEAAAASLAAAAGSGEDVPTDQLARAGKAFAEAHSANGAQALAWQRLSQKDYVTAAAWFQAARSWAAAPDEDPKTTEGLVIALRGLRRDDEAETLAYQGGEHDESLRGLYLETVADRLTRKSGAAPDAAGLKRFADAVVAAKSGNGAQALGWYSYNARQFAAAAAWFDRALGFEPSENAALGAAFAYRKLRDRENYARVLETYRDAYPRIGKLAGARNMRERRAALDNVEAPQKRFRQALDAPSGSAPASADVGRLNTQGWALLNQTRPAEAAQSFEAALQTATGRQRQEAAYGRSLALLASGDGVKAARTATSAELTAPQRRELGMQLLERRAWDAYNADRYIEALSWLDRRLAFAAETRDLLRMRVWCLTKLGRVEAAEAIQSQLDRQLAQ